MATTDSDSRSAALAAVRRGEDFHGLYDEAKVLEFLGNAERQLGEEGKRLDAAPTGDALNKGFKIFNNRICPFGNRAFWSMLEKGVADEFEYIHIDLGPTKPTWYQGEGVNPSGTVPCVYEDGKPVFESSPIVEYFEDRFPGRGTALMPESPADKAAVRGLIANFNSTCIKPCYQLLMCKDAAEDEAKATAVKEVLAKLEKWYTEQSASGPFFLGEALSAADVNVVPFLARFQHTLKYYRGFDMWAGDAFPRLKALVETATARPAFASTFPGAEFFIASYSRYAGYTEPGSEGK